jgi:hypothetical protein
MSAHRVLKDLFRAFEANGPGVLNDPGDAGSIEPTMWGQQCLITTAAAETRTLARPAKAGIMCSVVLDTDGGDLTLTVTGGFNDGAETVVTLDDAGDMVVFMSAKTGTTYQWTVIHQEGTSIGDLATTSGAGIVSADNFASGVEKIGSLFKTTIIIDIDGLDSSTTLTDIIGGTGLADCHLGQITAARNGTIFAGEVTCIEAPTGGDADIDLYSATESTGTENAVVTGLTETALLTAASTWTAGEDHPLTAYPAADEYLYLVVGAGGTAAEYTAGILKIELWGK